MKKIICSESKNIKSGLLKTRGISVPISEPKWEEKEDLIHLSLSSSGAFGLKWMSGLKKDMSIGAEAYFFLANQTQGVRDKETFDLVFMDACIFFSLERHIAKAKEYANDLGFKEANSEIFPLLCELFMYQSNGLKRPSTVILIHEEVLDRKGKPMLLTIDLQEKSTKIGHCPFVDKEKLFKADTYFVFASK